MKLSPNLMPLNIIYPSKKRIPKDLLNSPLAEKFISSSKRIPFREQFANEAHPHTMKHIHYQFGTVEKRLAVKFFYKKNPFRIVYSKKKDDFAADLMQKTPPKTKFPPNTVSSPIARSLREYALKWIVEQFFSKIEYLSFDEPILEGVNPDCFIIPSNQANKVLDLAHKYEVDANGLVEVALDDAVFVEIKAYHESSLLQEKEILQAFNYAVRGGKALLITTGTFGEYENFDIINNSIKIKNKAAGEIYDQETYDEFVKAVKTKSRSLIKTIDMSHSQDSFDTRGIYISASSKLKKIHKYTAHWPDKIEYTKLTTPESILEFLHRPEKLGLVEPMAFYHLLKKQGLTKCAALLKRIRETYLEEIIINPTLLYPR